VRTGGITGSSVIGGLRQVGHTCGQAIQLIIGRAIPIFAAIAAFLLRRYWRRLAPLYMILIFTTLLHAATHAEARLSEPFQPVLLLLLAAGFQTADSGELVHRFRWKWSSVGDAGADLES